MTLDKPRPFYGRRLANFSVGIGAGVVMLWLLPLMHYHLRGSIWAEFLSMFLAMFLVSVGLMIGLHSFHGPTADQMVNPAEVRRAPPSQILQLRYTAATWVLAGLMMYLPLAFTSGTVMQTPLGRWTAMAVLTVLFAIQTYINLRFWQKADEFVRRMVAEVSGLCFWILQGGLFLWAAAEKLSLVPQLGAWGGFAVLMTVYLVTSLFISYRGNIVR